MQRLTFKSDITHELLLAIEPRMMNVFLQRLREKERLSRLGFYHRKVEPVFFFILRMLCALLLIIGGIALLLPESRCNSLVFNIFIFLFGAIVLFIFWDRDKLHARLAGFRERFFSWVAKKRAHLTLKQAIKLAPYQAEYECRGNSLSYYRIKDDVALFAWNRKIKGFFIMGQGFTFLYKDEKTPHPYAVFLHDSTELKNYLIDQNCYPLVCQPSE